MLPSSASIILLLKSYPVFIICETRSRQILQPTRCAQQHLKDIGMDAEEEYFQKIAEKLAAEKVSNRRKDDVITRYTLQEQSVRVLL